MHLTFQVHSREQIQVVTQQQRQSRVCESNNKNSQSTDILSLRSPAQQLMYGYICDGSLIRSFLSLCCPVESEASRQADSKFYKQTYETRKWDTLNPTGLTRCRRSDVSNQQAILYISSQTIPVFVKVINSIIMHNSLLFLFLQHSTPAPQYFGCCPQCTVRTNSLFKQATLCHSSLQVKLNLS